MELVCVRPCTPWTIGDIASLPVPLRRICVGPSPLHYSKGNTYPRQTNRAEIGSFLSTERQMGAASSRPHAVRRNPLIVALMQSRLAPC